MSQLILYELSVRRKKKAINHDILEKRSKTYTCFVHTIGKHKIIFIDG